MYYIYLESDVQKGEKEHEGVTGETREEEMEYREWGSIKSWEEEVKITSLSVVARG